MYAREPLMPEVLNSLPRLLPDFWAGLALNVQMAFCALLIGVVPGAVLALLRFKGAVLSSFAKSVMAVLRVVPTIVLMFFFINVVSGSVSVGRIQIVMTPWLAVVLSLAVYAATSVCDMLFEAIRQLRSGSHVAAMLFVLNLLRVFLALVLASGFGAAIGVVESTAVTMRALENLPKLSQKLWLICMALVFFTLIFQFAHVLLGQVHRKIQARYSLY